MYANPALIKKHEFKIRVDDPVEAKIIVFLRDSFGTGASR